MSYYLEAINQEKNHRRILKNISLEINDNSILAILGPSGGGKTTLLNILARIDQPSYGKFYSSDNIAPKGIMIFQDYRLFPNMTVFQNIAFGLRVKKKSRSLINIRCQKIMKTMDIADLAEYYPHELSGGQQQRVSLARAMILQPKLLLMDEPFSSLDENLRLEMLNFVKKIQEKFKMTIVFVTHFKTEAYLLSNQVAILIDGQIMQKGTPKEIETHPESFAVAKFLGQANFIPGELDENCFISSIYRGPVEIKSDSRQLLYIPFSNLITVDKTDYFAFEAVVKEINWIVNENRLVLNIDQVQIQINSNSSQFKIGKSYKFYFKQLPVVF